MATAGQWLAGARPRTLPASIAPVLAGTGAAAAADGFTAWKAATALLVAVALQVGSNYANDYADGVRGTDEKRVGPFRLVGSKAAEPAAVKAAAGIAFAVAAISGTVLALASAPWLLLVGAAAIAAAWFYTAGPKPYGYHALGEVGVFVFFGLVATVGTAYVQTLRFTWPALAAGIAVGALTCAILVANNLRDIPTDAASGKRTLAVVLDDRRTRALYVGLVAVAYPIALVIAVGGLPWALLTLGSVPLALSPVRVVLGGATGRDLIAVLQRTSLTVLGFATLLGLGLALG